jgi:hypothetical protein
MLPPRRYKVALAETRKKIFLITGTGNNELFIIINFVGEHSSSHCEFGWSGRG